MNATLTMTYWLVGRAISINSLRDGRADYGKQILGTLSQELSARFGAEFDQSNLSRMVQFARLFPDHGTVADLATRISWSQVYTLLAIKSDEARTFYTAEAATKRLSVRELKKAIALKAYERREIANSQIPEGSAVPRDTFKNPILDTLGLHDTFLEKDLEAAILRDVQAFLLEVGNGFAFVTSQKRMIIDGDDFVVAEYWTALPPKAELQAKLTEIVRDAQERLARHRLPVSPDRQQS